MLKILWITNMLLPKPAKALQATTSPSGTWMFDISERLSTEKDVQLAVACVYGKEFKKIEIDNVTYYMLPGTGKNMLFYTKRFEKLWKQINAEFQPDIVHLHGTEYSHGLAFLRACPDVTAVVTIQGIINRIKDADFGELPARVFFWNRTLREWLHMNGALELHSIHKKNAKYEREIFSRVKYVNGINAWDISICKMLNPNAKIFQIQYNLRDEIYQSNKWSVANIKRHTIFTNPGGIPLKGLHQLFKAVALLKDKYPDIRVNVPGMGKDGKLTVTDSYSKYLGKLIKKLGIENNVVFLGRQTADEICTQILSANVTVIPSTMENVSTMLREAMYLGCPCIASFRGGMADFVSDKVDGFLYDYPEYAYLANRIDELFSNDELCQTFSQNAIRKAEKAHDRTKNVQAYLDMYYEIYKDEK